MILWGQAEGPLARTHDHREKGCCMAASILGKKLGMTQIFDEDANVVPVTVIQAGPCVVSQVKTADTCGYDAIQVGFGEVKENKVNRPASGHFKKAGIAPMRHLREIAMPEAKDGEQVKVGDTITVADFEGATNVDVVGTSKGKGYQGTIKRWNFSRGPMTHGSRNQRRPGSIGQCAYPARVRKGLHMSGQMGNDRVTVKNLKLVRIDPEQNLMLIKGAVPGAKDAIVEIHTA